MAYVIRDLPIILVTSVVCAYSGMADGTNELRSSPPSRLLDISQRLQYYGHYWVESGTYGSHLAEVTNYCNVHWVEGIQGLQHCASNGVQCILQVRWEFFSGGGGEGKVQNPIRPDYEIAWSRLVEEITPYTDRIEAFYIIDEPYWNGVNCKDLATSIRAIKKRFPHKPVMVIFAVPSLTTEFVVPADADWIGFDCYEPIDTVVKHLQFMRGRLHPHQRLFLVPQSFLNTSTRTDHDLAKLNWQYYELASSDPLIIGMLNYGLFTDAKAEELPLTLKAQHEIRNLIRMKSRTKHSK